MFKSILMSERIRIFDFLLEVKSKLNRDMCYLLQVSLINQSKWSSRFDQLQISMILASSSFVIILCIKIDILYLFSSTHWTWFYVHISTHTPKTLHKWCMICNPKVHFFNTSKIYFTRVIILLPHHNIMIHIVARVNSDVYLEQ